MQKTLLFACACSAALLFPTTAFAGAKPSPADDQVSGVGEFWIGYSFLSDDLTPVPVPFDDSYMDLGGSLRVNIPAGGQLDFQLDFMGESAFVDDTSNNYTGSVLGGGHLSFREPNEWLLGGFFGIGNGHSVGEDSVTAWLVGAEGQWYLPDWTFYGQLGYLDAADVNTGNDEAFRGAWFVRGVARLFLESNVKLEGELSYADGENDVDEDDMSVLGWGLRYERGISSMDVNVFVAYQGNRYEAEDAADVDELTEHVLKLGLNVPFGVEGQKYIDRHGATLDLPMVTRWSAYGVDVMD